MAQIQRTAPVPVREEPRAIPALLARVQPAAVGLALVEAVIGYEWLLSALDKIFSPTFRSGLAQQVKMNMQGNPNTWWVALARRLVLPHAPLFGLLVEVGELFVALGFFAGAVLWLRGRVPVAGWGQRLNLGVVAALLGGALMTANYYVMAGKTLPGLNPGDPFDEGLSLGGVLTLLALGLLVIHAAPLWRRTAQRGARADQELRGASQMSR